MANSDSSKLILCHWFIFIMNDKRLFVFEVFFFEFLMLDNLSLINSTLVVFFFGVIHCILAEFTAHNISAITYKVLLEKDFSDKTDASFRTLLLNFNC